MGHMPFDFWMVALIGGLTLLSLVYVVAMDKLPK
jgi:lipid-A-disaccharide synthase-like uncharacterized protein